jgi:hypothetical protein
MANRPIEFREGVIHPADNDPAPLKPGDKLTIGTEEFGEVLFVTGNAPAFVSVAPRLDIAGPGAEPLRYRYAD